MIALQSAPKRKAGRNKQVGYNRLFFIENQEYLLHEYMNPFNKKENEMVYCQCN